MASRKTLSADVSQLNAHIDKALELPVLTSHMDKAKRVCDIIGLLRKSSSKPVRTATIARRLKIPRTTTINWTKHAVDAGLVHYLGQDRGYDVGPAPEELEIRTTKTSEVVECLGRLANGKPTTIRAIAEDLDRPVDQIRHHLQVAEETGLACRKSRFEWVPAADSDAGRSDYLVTDHAEVAACIHKLSNGADAPVTIQDVVRSLKITVSAARHRIKRAVAAGAVRRISHCGYLPTDTSDSRA